MANDSLKRWFMILLFSFLIGNSCSTTDQNYKQPIPIATSETPPTMTVELHSPVSTETVLVHPAPMLTPTSSITPIEPLPVQTTTTQPPTIAPDQYDPVRLLNNQAIIIDHTVVDSFEHIPPEYIRAASEYRWFYRMESVGANIQDGLRCMMDEFDRRPSFCDRGLNSEEKFTGKEYDFTNWFFEFHAPLPNPNPGWQNKANFFIERINNLEPGEQYDAAGYQFCYVDVLQGSQLAEQFFESNASPNIYELEQLEETHPDLRIVYFTTCLARSVGTPEATRYNQLMREYALVHGKVLFDLADIESHAPDGTLCVDNQGRGLPAICQDYTDEIDAGHLNARGRLRLAKAMWILIARLSGWDGISSP
jgi:hypothetical protein